MATAPVAWRTSWSRLASSRGSLRIRSVDSVTVRAPRRRRRGSSPRPSTLTTTGGETPTDAYVETVKLRVMAANPVFAGAV